MSRWAPPYRGAFQHLKNRLNHNHMPDLFSRSGAGRLIVLFATAIYATFLIGSDNANANFLFQSPQSPAVEPSSVQPAAEQQPVEQQPVEQQPVEQPPAEQPAAEPTPAEQPVIEQPAVEQPALEQPALEQSPTEQPSVEQPAVELAAPEDPFAEPIRPEQDEFRATDEEGNQTELTLDRVELIDTIVVSGAYIWLCCGVGLFLIAPLFFLFLQIRGGSKINRQENF